MPESSSSSLISRHITNIIHLFRGSVGGCGNRVSGATVRPHRLPCLFNTIVVAFDSTVQATILTDAPDRAGVAQTR